MWCKIGESSDAGKLKVCSTKSPGRAVAHLLRGDLYVRLRREERSRLRRFWGTNMNELKIEFAGATRVLEHDESLTFGRDADLEIDTNPYLHLYELNLAMPDSPSFDDLDEPIDGPPTIRSTEVPLNDEQRLLLVTLAELRLRDRGAPSSAIPPNRVVSQRLGWSTTKFNRKLDNLCGKFHRLGVAGLKGDSGALASNRRERLVNHVLTTGLIARSDLELLDAFDR